MNKRWLTAMAVAAMGAMAVDAFGQATQPQQDAAAREYRTADATPQHVALFKNGYAVVDAEIATPEAGAYEVGPLPTTTLGSAWLNWPGSMRLTNVRATETELGHPETAVTPGELLRANVGKRASVLFAENWYSGTIMATPVRQPRVEPPVPLPGPRSRVLPPIPYADVVLLKTEDGVMALRLSQIAAVRFAESPNETYPSPEPAMKLRFTVDRDANQQAAENAKWPVRLQYVAAGMAWSPSYRVDISQPGKAAVAAKAVVINDLIDLENARVELVTGFPHLKHAEVSSGLTAANLAAFLAQLRGDQTQQPQNVVLMQNVRGLMEAAPGAAGGAMGPVLPGQQTEDLYFYPLAGVTLAKGERGYFPLFTAMSDYEHLYTWDIASPEENGYRPMPQQEQDVDQIVWHSLKLENQTTLPWTTAPAMVVKDGRVLGQDTIEYTPAGTSTELRITQALSFDAKHEAREIERTRDAEIVDRAHYDLVTLEGKLSLINRLDRPVNVKITRTFQGEITQAEGEPQIEKLAVNLNRVNPQSRVTWQQEVKPGEQSKLTLTYRYRVYVRR